jgi:hypothetical protein
VRNRDPATLKRRLHGPPLEGRPAIRGGVLVELHPSCGLESEKALLAGELSGAASWMLGLTPRPPNERSAPAKLGDISLKRGD